MDTDIFPTELAGRLAAKLVQRVDGWQNLITGLGTIMRDKRKSFHNVRSPNITHNVDRLDELFHNDDLSRTIITKKVDTALSKGIVLSRDNGEEGEPETSDDQVKQLDEALRKWQLLDKVKRAAWWGRLYGRGAVFLVFDTNRHDEPLDLDNPGKLEDLIVLERRDFSAATLSSVTMEPEHWRLAADNNPLEDTPHLVHTSRMIIFGGAPTTRRRRLDNSHSDDSVLQAPLEALESFHSAFGSVTHRMQDFSQGVFRMKGLFRMLTENKYETIQTRMQVTDMGRSVARALLLDADSESFDYMETSFAGVPEILDRHMQRLSASAEGMPVTVLFGVSQSGLGNEGTSDQRNWASIVSVYQTNELELPIRLLVNLVGATEGLGNGWSVSFPPVWVFTPGEIADIRLKTAQTDALYIDKAVYLAEEVAASRAHEDGEFRPVEIDLEQRKVIAEAMLAQKELEATKPPEPMPPALAAANGDPVQDPAAEPAEGGEEGDPQEEDPEKEEGAEGGQGEPAEGNNDEPGDDVAEHRHALPGGEFTGAAAGRPGHTHSLPDGTRTQEGGEGESHTHEYAVDGETKTTGPAAPVNDDADPDA